MEDKGIVTLSGHRFYTVKGFAEATNRKEGSVYRLIRDGNMIRKLIYAKFGPNIFIPELELYNYPFKMSGKNNSVMRFVAPGEVELCKIGDLLDESVIRKELEVFGDALDAETLEE